MARADLRSQLAGRFARRSLEVYFVRRGLSWVMVGAGVLFTLLAIAALARLVRGDRVAAFWASGAALALIPVCAAHPTDRHLFLVGLGGLALAAQLVGAWVERDDPARRRLLPRASVAAGRPSRSSSSCAPCCRRWRFPFAR